MQSKHLIMGVWKFDPEIGKARLLSTARTWAQDPRYVQIYIRGIAEDQLGIGFAYLFDGSEKAMNDFFQTTKSQLDEAYGADLSGWDISSECELVKGF